MSSVKQIFSFVTSSFSVCVSIYMHMYKCTLAVGQHNVKHNSARMPIVGVKLQDSLALCRDKGLDSCLNISRKILENIHQSACH